MGTETTPREDEKCASSPEILISGISTGSDPLTLVLALFNSQAFPEGLAGVLGRWPVDSNHHSVITLIRLKCDLQREME